MRYKIIFVFLIVSKYANSYEIPRILEDTRKENEHGYNFRYSTSDGQEREENGQFERIGDNLILRITGFYSYISRDGSQFKVFYQADEEGYKPRIQFIGSSKSKTIIERQSKHEFETTKNPSTDSLATLTADESPVGAGTKPDFNSTQTTPTISVGFSSPEIVSQISSGAIASLAGGGLG